MTQPEAIPAPAAHAHALRNFYERHERGIALGAFVAGFLVDVLTLPRVDSWTAIARQAIYIAVIAAILVHAILDPDGEAAPAQPAGPGRWYREYRTAIVHFLFGSLLNLYTIYFFKSSSLLVSFSFMIALVVLLAANESKRLRSRGPAFRFALLGLCLLSFSAQVTPIFVGSIGPLVFVLSMLLGALPLTALAFAIGAWSPGRFSVARRAILLPQGCMLLGFLAFYALRLVPPVPLSIPFMGIYHSVERTAEGYRLEHEPAGWRFWRRGDQEFLARPGDRVYVFFRILSPTRFSERVLARWYWRNPARGWELTDTLPVNIVGGRAEGFRGFGYKSNYRPGDWRVQVETQDGREIGRIYFRLALALAAPRVFVTEIR